MARFKALVEATPVVAPATHLSERKPDNTAIALNAEEQQVASLLGMSEAEFIKGKA